jgi:hypothetical protein
MSREKVEIIHRGGFVDETVKDKKIAYRATEESRRKLQIAAIERGTKVQGLIDAALEAYLGEDSVQSPSGQRGHGEFSETNAGERRFLREMLDFYRAADEVSVKLVRQHAAAISELRSAKRLERKTG